MLQKRFFKTKDEVEVTFSLERENGAEVAVVCEENGWVPVPMAYSKKNQAYQARIRLPKGGEYQFRYLIDGQAWENDPAADAYRQNEYGGQNGVVITRE